MERGGRSLCERRGRRPALPGRPGRAPLTAELGPGGARAAGAALSGCAPRGPAPPGCEGGGRRRGRLGLAGFHQRGPAARRVDLLIQPIFLALSLKARVEPFLPLPVAAPSRAPLGRPLLRLCPPSLARSAGQVESLPRVSCQNMISQVCLRLGGLAVAVGTQLMASSPDKERPQPL